MLLLILGILALVAGFVTTSSINAMSRREWERRKSEAERYNRSFSETYEKISFPAYIGTVVAIILIVVSCIAVVPTGYTGILTTFGRVEERTIASGANVIAPWQKVIRMDNRTQKVQIETAAFSSDIRLNLYDFQIRLCCDDVLLRFRVRRNNGALRLGFLLHRLLSLLRLRSQLVLRSDLLCLDRTRKRIREINVLNRNGNDVHTVRPHVVAGLLYYLTGQILAAGNQLLCRVL